MWVVRRACKYPRNVNIVMFMICIVLLLCLACSTKASEFSIGYLASPKISIKVFNVGGVLETTPDALHVADLYTRLNGMTPLLSTGKN